jgi:hypothetical protein
MTSMPFIGRQSRRPSCRRACRPRLDTLEERRLLTGTVPSGDYVEDFQLNSDPSKPGWDVGGAFVEQVTHGADTEVITDPNKVEGEGWSLDSETSGGTDFKLDLQGSFYFVSFPRLMPGVHVAGIGIDVNSQKALVQIAGEHGLYNTWVQGDKTQHVFVGEELVLPSGLEIGAIRGIEVAPVPPPNQYFFSFAKVDNLTILVVPDGPPNRPPVARDDSATVPPGQSVDIGVLDNDYDPDGDLFHIIPNGVGTPSHGSAAADSSGDIEYTANPSFHGSDSFTYTIEDSHGATATATVTVFVDTPPIASDRQFFVPHGTTGSFSVAGPGLLDPDKIKDADGDPLTLTVADGALGHVSFDAMSGRFTYTPNDGGLVRADQFTYTVSDGVATATGTVFLTPVNQPPPAAADLTEGVRHGIFGPLTFAAPGLFAVNPHTDSDGDTLRPVLETDPFYPQPRSGRVALNDDGSFTYTPNDPTLPDQDETFTYRLFDGYEAGPPAKVHLHVPNNAPIAHGADLQFPHDQLGKPVDLGNVSLYATDPDSDTLRLGAVVVTGGGTLTSNNFGVMSFVPAPGQTYLSDSGAGTVRVSISLTVTDGSASSNAVDFNLIYPNSAPVAADLSIDVPKERHASAYSRDLSLLDANGYTIDPLDQDGDPVHAVVVRGPTNGTLSIAGAIVSYRVLAGGGSGSLNHRLTSDSFTYYLTDGYENSNVATVTLVPDRGDPTLYPDVLAVSSSSPGINRDILSNDVFWDLTPVSGHGIAIFAGSDAYTTLIDQSGHSLNFGDPLDFGTLRFRLDTSTSGGSSGFPYEFQYGVQYHVNDDPGSPTARTNLLTPATVKIIVYDHAQADDDGIDDDVENQAPNNGDGNSDGIPDSQESNVASLPDSIDGQDVTLASPPGTALADVKAVRNPSPDDVPSVLQFPLGFFHFELTGPFVQTVNGVKQLTNSTFVDLISPIDLPPPSDFHYYRYGPTPGNLQLHWYDFVYDSTTQVGAELLSSRRVRLHFIDGERGDDDLEQNGMIVDAGGPAFRRHFASPAAGFVTVLYDLVLEREPTTQELQHGTQQLAAGISRLLLAREVWNSAEHRGMEVDRMYQTYLHRAAEPAGRAFWVRVLQSGLGETAVARRFLTSREYHRAHLTLRAFVDGLEADVLGGPPNASGRMTRRLLRLGAQAGRAALAREILSSRVAAERLLTADDERVLGRAARPAEVRRAMSELRVQTGAPATIAERILASKEFFDRVRALSAQPVERRHDETKR